MAETLIFETTCSGLSSESGSPPFPNFTVDGNDLFSACRVGSAVGSFDSPSVDTLSILSGDVITLPSGKIYRVEIDSGDLTYYWSPFGNSGYDDNPIAVRVLGVKWDTGSNTNVNNFMASDEFNDNWFAPGESAIVSTPNIEAASPVNIDFGFGFDNTDFSDTGNGPISSTHTITGADYSTPFMSIRIYEVTAGVAPEFDPFPVALPNGMDNNVYSADVKPLMVVIGDPVPTFTLSTGTIPPGLTLNSDGTITGTPTTPGDYSFDIDATNSAGGSVGPFTLRITIEGTLPEFD